MCTPSAGDKRFTMFASETAILDSERWITVVDGVEQLPKSHVNIFVFIHGEFSPQSGLTLEGDVLRSEITETKPSGERKKS